MVLYAVVIPQHHNIWFPLHPALNPWVSGGALVKLLQQHFAFPARNAFNTSSNTAVGKQVRLTVLRLYRYQGVRCLGVGLTIAQAKAVVAQINLAVVVGSLADQHLLHIGRQFREGCMHIGEHCVSLPFSGHWVT